MVCEGIAGGTGGGYGVRPNPNPSQKGVPGFDNVRIALDSDKPSDVGKPSRLASVFKNKGAWTSVYKDPKSGEITYRYNHDGHTVEAYDSNGNGNINRYTIFGGDNKPNKTYYSLTDAGSDDFFNWEDMGWKKPNK